MERAPSKIQPREFERLVAEHMSNRFDFDFSVESLASGFARVRLRYDEAQLRHGGTIAGPVLFTLADTALYAAVLATVGLVPAAVTTDMSLHFLRRPAPADLVAEARLLKQGRQLQVGEVTIWSDGDPDPVTHVTGTYAVPPSRGASATASDPPSETPPAS